MELSGFLDAIAAHMEPPDPASVELRAGQFHDVVVAPDMVYRFPRGELDRAAIAARAGLLSALSRAELSVAVPTPVYTGAASEPLGRCFLATTRVPGRPLGRGEAGDGEHVGAALCVVLADLAAVTPAVLHLVEAEPTDRWERFAAEVEEVLFPLMSRAGRERADSELSAVRRLLPAPELILCHGDLGGGNLLWESEPLRLSGIIDWDSASLSGPAADVASIAATFGWQTAERAAADLSDADAVLARARMIRATFALQQALPAALAGDTVELDDGLSGYR